MYHSRSRGSSTIKENKTEDDEHKGVVCGEVRPLSTGRVGPVPPVSESRCTVFHVSEPKRKRGLPVRRQTSLLVSKRRRRNPVFVCRSTSGQPPFTETLVLSVRNPLEEDYRFPVKAENFLLSKTRD